MRIDLNTYFAKSDLNVWVMHPGRGKRFFKDFLDRGIFFLDLPRADLTEELIGNRETLIKEIAKSEAIQKYHNVGGIDYPSLARDSFIVLDEDKRKYNSIVSAVKRFVTEIKKGDLIIVPQTSQYKDMIIGIVEDNFDEAKRTYVKRYDKDYVLARKYKKINKSITKRHFSANVAEKLGNQNTIVKLQGYEREEVLTLALGSYMTEASSKIDLYCPKYSGKNSLELHSTQVLINYFIAIYDAHQRGEFELIINKSVFDVARNYYEADFIESIEHEFHSPGFFRLKTKSAILASFVAIMITLPALSVGASVNRDSVDIYNSKMDELGVPENGAIDVEELQKLIESTVSSISNENMDEVKRLAQESKDNVNLKTDIKFEN